MTTSSTLSGDVCREMVSFLDEVEASITSISIHAENNTDSLGDCQLETQSILRDVTFVSELFPGIDGNHFIVDLYSWLKRKKAECCLK